MHPGFICNDLPAATGATLAKEWSANVNLPFSLRTNSNCRPGHDQNQSAPYQSRFAPPEKITFPGSKTRYPALSF